MIVKRYGNDAHEGIIKIETMVVEDFVCIKIMDNGCGIPEHLSSKIFDPFFTTKGVGKGKQGHINNAIEQKHKGRLFFESIINSGTSFFIELPLKTMIMSHKFRIIFVDDDLTILKGLKRRLKRLRRD